MSLSKGESFGVGKKNEAVELGRFESQGPAAIVARNLSTTGKGVISVEKKSDGSLVATDKDTAVSGEDTGYDGDTSTLAFSGQALNNVPIVPGSVTVKPTAGGTTVNATDRDGDGILYTADDDEDACGTIDYFTGALVLAYPTGKAPNTTNITADYTYQDSVLAYSGQKTFTISNVQQEEELIVKGASDVEGGTRMRVEMVSTWE